MHGDGNYAIIVLDFFAGIEGVAKDVIQVILVGVGWDTFLLTMADL